MKLVKMGFLLALMVAGFGMVKAQTVDEIVNKSIDAMGGKEKLAQIKSAIMHNTSQVMGAEGPSTLTVLNGVGYKMETEMNGQKIIMVITEKGGWQVNPFGGSNSPTPLPEEMAKQGRSKVDVTGPLYNYAAKGSKITLLGKEGNAYKLKVVDKDSIETTVYIDATTYQMTKLTAMSAFMGQSMEVSSTFSNFKKGDLGITLPYAIEVSYGGQFNITTTVNKIELNTAIDPAIFEMPKS